MSLIGKIIDCFRKWNDSPSQQNCEFCSKPLKPNDIYRFDGRKCCGTCYKANKAKDPAASSSKRLISVKAVADPQVSPPIKNQQAKEERRKVPNEQNGLAESEKPDWIISRYCEQVNPYDFVSFKISGRKTRIHCHVEVHQDFMSGTGFQSFHKINEFEKDFMLSGFSEKSVLLESISAYIVKCTISVTDCDISAWKRRLLDLLQSEKIPEDILQSVDK